MIKSSTIYITIHFINRKKKLLKIIDKYISNFLAPTKAYSCGI